MTSPEPLEFVVAHSIVSDIKAVEEKLKILFNITLEYGPIFEKETRNAKQWIRIAGDDKKILEESKVGL